MAVTAGIMIGSLIAPASASAGTYCNNGTYSSNAGRGTCSWNGGVNKSMPSYSDPGSSSWNRQYGFGSSSSSRRNTFSDPFASSSRRNTFSDPFASSTKRSRW
jgi:hypothetical protein